MWTAGVLHGVVEVNQGNTRDKQQVGSQLGAVTGWPFPRSVTS